MDARIRGLTDEYKNLLAQADKLRDEYKGQLGNMTPEQAEQFDRILDAADKLEATIASEKRLVDMKGRWSEPETAFEHAGIESKDAPPEAIEEKTLAKWEQVGYRREKLSTKEAEALDALQTKAYQRYLLGGFRALRAKEAKALQADLDVSGGYLQMPLQMVNALIQALDNTVSVRGLTRNKYRLTTAESLGAPSLDTDIADPTWTSEILVGSEDSSMAFGRRELTPQPLAQYIKVSRTLLRRSPAAESLVNERMMYKFATVEENAFLNGSGSNEPLGVFTAATEGVTTSQDVTATAAVDPANDLGGDDFLNVKFDMAPQYWPGCTWILHRTILKEVRQLKDGNSNYIWGRGLAGGEDPTIADFPYVLSEYAPSVSTTGLYVAVLGNWDHYWIADALDSEIQRLDELYAATNQIGFIGRKETDGMPVLAAAFRRLKMG